MAINVDSVYQKVLAIANKEQRGYITPLEFNLLANQAQDSIFEQYFYDIKQWNDQQSSNSTEYSDMLTSLEEKIAPFKINNAPLAGTVLYEEDFEAGVGGYAGTATITNDTPSSSNNFNGGLKVEVDNATQNATATDVVTLVAGKKYKFSWTITAMVEPDSYFWQFLPPAGTADVQHLVNDPSLGAFDFTFVADDSGSYDIRLTLTTSPAAESITIGEVKLVEIDDTTIGNGTDIVYRLGEVLWQAAGQAYPTQVPHVNANQITKYNISPLARPTASNPVYVRTGNTSIQLYPTPAATDTITHNFIRKPAEVYFGYVLIPQSQGGNEYPLYDAANSVDFDLHQSEENTLVYKILELAGIILNKPGLIQIASGEEQQITQEEKV
tara:strand:- start:499 stop:1647 length:1149 start_codon:yes stop_codon:yes gene_type:complete